MHDEFHIRVAGSSFRQETISQLLVDEPCHLLPEPDNPHDPNAIRLICPRLGAQFGYVPREQALVLGKALAAGCHIEATVSGLGRPTVTAPIGVVVKLVVNYSTEGTPCPNSLASAPPTSTKPPSNTP